MGQRIPKTPLKKHLRGAASRDAASESELPKQKAQKKAVSKKPLIKGSITAAPAEGFQVIESWLADKGLSPFLFQKETWEAFAAGKSGIVNAPTGFGKTFSVFLAVIIDWINRNPYDYQIKTNNGLQLIWISPLRALAKDIHRAMEMALEELQIPWRVGVRHGDTGTAERQQQVKKMPEILLITPESLHLLLATKNHDALFQDLRCVAVDEWHELLGTKRGVQVELALSALRKTAPPHSAPKGREPDGNEQGACSETNPTTRDIQISSPLSKGEGPGVRLWALSATIGNLEEAMRVLLGNDAEGVLIRSHLKREIELKTILPERVEVFPYAGHLGLKMIDRVLPVIFQSQTTLLFTNVRSAAEMWYQALLDAAPELAGQIALHHSAIDGVLRAWVEEQLHEGNLKVVVATASLDLGVDFRPVDTVIQVGSPKGVARFLQRAGRSGHQPGAVSRIYFVPTHSLEILEGAALQQALQSGHIESRKPVVLAYDVLAQYMVTRAVGGGFKSEELYQEVIATHCFADLGWDEWQQLLAFITTGGATLHGYEDYHKVGVREGLYLVQNRRVAMHHRMQIGTIVGDALMRVKFMGGGFIGTIEENFISRLKPGDAFILAGRKLELIQIKDMDVIVRRSNAKSALVPAWLGGRLPLSQSLGDILRQTFQEAIETPFEHPLYEFLQPLLQRQARLSGIAAGDDLLVELIDTRDGFHLFAYPFEGRLVHQALAALVAYRLSRRTPISFSIAMNDYGFELLSDQPIPVSEADVRELFSPENFFPDLQQSLNNTELARRKFRDIAVIAGLIFQGFPGAGKKARHLQNSAALIYDVLSEHEPNHLLLQQAHHEVWQYEVEAERLQGALTRIYTHEIVLRQPAQLTPFCFPIKVDSLREQLSSEKLEDRVRKMQEQLGRM